MLIRGAATTPGRPGEAVALLNRAGLLKMVLDAESSRELSALAVRLGPSRYYLLRK
jgi:hypothetical protein